MAIESADGNTQVIPSKEVKNDEKPQLSVENKLHHKEIMENLIKYETNPEDYPKTELIEKKIEETPSSEKSVENDISKKIGEINPKEKLAKLKKNNQRRKRSRFVRWPHWKLIIAPIIIVSVLLPFMPLGSNEYNPMVANYMSAPTFEFGDEGASLDWEFLGLTGISTRYSLYINDEKIDAGKFVKHTQNYSYFIKDLNLGLGEYKFRLEIKDSIHDIINLGSFSIDNYAPFIICKNEAEIFESNSLEIIEFSVNDTSVKSPHSEFSIIDRYSNKVIKTESDKPKIDVPESDKIGNFIRIYDSENNKFPISDFDPGLYEINYTFFDGLGLNTTIIKQFSVFENLGPRISPSYEKGIDVELGEIFYGHFDVKDYNVNRNGTYLITLDEDNNNPLASGIWDGGNYYEYSVNTENLSIGYHSVSLLITDYLGENSISYIDFDLKYTKDPDVSIDSSLNFITDYKDPYISFTVSDFELYRNATYEISLNNRRYSGYLIQFVAPQYKTEIEPSSEKFCIDYVMIPSIENMPSTINGKFEIQKYLLLGENEVGLTITDGKGGETSIIFIVILEELVVKPNENYNILYFVTQPWIVLLILYPVMFAFKLITISGKWIVIGSGRIKKISEDILHYLFNVKNKKEIREQRKNKRKLKRKLNKKQRELKRILNKENKSLDRYKKKEIKELKRKIEEEKRTSDFFNLNSILIDLLTLDEKKEELLNKELTSILIDLLTLDEKKEELLNKELTSILLFILTLDQKRIKLLSEKIDGIKTQLARLNEEKGLNRKNYRKIPSIKKMINPSHIKIKAKLYAKVFGLLFLSFGIVSMLTNAQGIGGDYPINTFDIAPTYNPEANVTGWDTNHTVMKIRLFDNLAINWVSTETAYNVIVIKNATDGEEIYRERMWLGAGPHSHSIYMDPERNLTDRYTNNFLPGFNYTIQIRLEWQNAPNFNLIGYSDELTFRIIKAKAQIEFFPPDYSDSTTPTGIYVVEHLSDPVDPHYEFNYQCRVVDAFRPDVALQDKEIRLFMYNATSNPPGYDFVNMQNADIHGKYTFSEKRYSMVGIPTALFETIEDDYYYYEAVNSMLNGDNIFSTFDYSGPGSITDEISNGTESAEPYVISTITELQRSYNWNTQGDFNGFLLNDTIGSYYQFDVSESLECLFLGTVTGNNLTATILSPAIYYYGQQIAFANLTTTFNTIYDRNNFSDPIYNDEIFDVDLLLYNEDGQILDEWALFNGDIEGYQTKSYSLNPNLFTKPTAFRIGYRVSIRVNESTFSFDSVDEFYFSLKEVDFHVIYDGPQYGNAGHLNGDWGGYTFEGRTKQMDCAFDTNSFSMFTRSGLTTSSSFGTITSTGEVILDSPVDFTHVDLQNSDVILNLNTEIQKIIYGGEEIDGSYSIYAIPLLSNGTRLDPIYINSDLITSTKSLDSVSLNLTSYLGQDIEKFSFRTWMSVDSEPIGIPDLYNVFFENVNISVNATDTLDLVSVSDPPSPPSYYIYRTLEQVPNPITLYNPESEGFIVDKLVAGEFAQETTVWDEFPTINGSHINASYYYSNGDYVIPEDEPINGSDETEQWTYLHTSANYINFESIFSAEDYCAGYTFAYIYFPRLETDVYLKLGSNDGSRIWFDSEEVCYNHVIRSLATQNSEEEHDIISLGPVAPGWHRVMTMTENKDKKYTMRYRISSTGGEGDANFTPISGLKIAVETPDYDPRFTPISMDCTPSKESKTDTNRNSLVLGIPEQRVSQSETEIMSLSPVTDASGLTSTLFDGTLNM